MTYIKNYIVYPYTKTYTIYDVYQKLYSISIYKNYTIYDVYHILYMTYIKNYIVYPYTKIIHDVWI